MNLVADSAAVRPLRILILGVKVPFTFGGQEALIRSLAKELAARGHLVDTVELPFVVDPKEQLLTQAALWRAWDFGRFGGAPVDLLIATKFPSYYAHGAPKSLWLVHQHRSMYDLYATRYSDFGDDPRDEELRRMLVQGDQRMLTECAYRSAISRNVAQRVSNFHQLSCETLYPPLPLGTRYQANVTPGSFVLSVGRICSIKRVDLMVKAMTEVQGGVTLKIAGVADEPGIMEYLTNEIRVHGLTNRVEFLGRVSDEQLIELYRDALCVYYAPHDEDYGYVTLEAMASAKPLITAHDSGGVLEFVEHGVNGLVVDPQPKAFAQAVNELASDAARARMLGAAGRALIERGGFLEAGWDSVIQGLLSPVLSQSSQSRIQAA